MTPQNGEHMPQAVLTLNENNRCRETLLFPGHVPSQIPTQRPPECQEAMFRELPLNTEELAPGRNNTVTTLGGKCVFSYTRAQPGLCHRLFLNRNLAVGFVGLKGTSLAPEVRPFRVLRKVGQKFFLPAGNNTEESASHPFY